MTRFLSTIILLSLAAFSQSKIIFIYSTTEAINETPATFSVGVDFEETEFSNFSVKEMKPRTDPQPMESVNGYNLTLAIIYIKGALTKDDVGACNILLETNSSTSRSISEDLQTPEESVNGLNSVLDAESLSEGKNFKSSLAVGPNSFQLNIQRPHPDLAQAITDANCNTLNLTFNLLI